MDLDDPPPGEPWDTPLPRCPLVFIDCEMTGSDPARDALVEVAMIRVVGDTVEDTVASLVRTEVPSTPAALALHGIPPEALAVAPSFSELAPRLSALVTGAVPVMHGARLDVAFLNRAHVSITGRRLLHHVLDTVALARRVVHLRSYGLPALAARLSLPARRWHRASEDVAGLRDLFAHVTAVLRPCSARDLWEVRVGQAGAVRVRTAFDRLFTQVQGSRRAVSLLVRTPGHDPVTLTARIERWSSPYLYLATGQRGANGVRVLRADRVLWAEETAVVKTGPSRCSR